jgi:hypothetical protein
MYWSKRTDLSSDPADVEWTSFSGNLSTGLKIDWAHPPQRIQTRLRRTGSSC